MTRAICHGVREETFYLPQNRVIWRAMLGLFTQKNTVTLEMLIADLTVRRQIDEVGGFPYLMQVTGRVPTTVHAGYFIEKVIQMRALREAIRIGTSIVESSYGYAGESMAEHLAPWLDELSKVQNGLTVRDEKTLQDAAADTIEIVRKMASGENVEPGLVSWGFADLDRIFYPMTPGELVIVAARPSVGKTTFADQIAIANAFRDSRHVGIFSLEVTVEQKPRKFAQIMSGHSWRRLPKLHEKDRIEFIQALDDLKKNKYLHCFYREQSIDGICARIRALNQQGKLQLAIVDYLQLLEVGGKATSRNDSIGDATRKLKLLALELNIPIILLSQLSRANEREGREPRLSDLRDSGNIEQDADRVLLLHRPQINPITNMPQDTHDESVDTFYTDIIQAKGRDVGTFRIGVYLKRSRTTFVPITRNEVQV
jgi:replicative DNA helicase